jgi:ParB/RepB/Spo0J family partition protein
MNQSVERTSLDLRFQTCRLRNDAAEARLLASIAERGIEQPLAGVDTPQARLLLDGFRRCRCAEKLGIECVPYVSWGEEETQGIASLMAACRQKPLSILEQARFVVELLTTHQMSMAEVAEMLSRSKAWVSMRRGLLAEMSPAVQEILFRGAFPVYSYMVTLRPFMRINGVGQQEMERFVRAVAGGKLSVREIELLAHGYFRGTASLREAIDQGNWKWSLEQMQAVPEDPEGCNDFEGGLLRELERLLKAMQNVMTRCESSRLRSRDFYAQANLLLASLLSRRESFFKKMEEFYDRSGQA